MNRIECAGWLESSCDDGPGIRSVLFLQGCRKNCRGCHNRRIREHGKGTMMSMDELLKFIDNNCCNKKITISGGEPMEQMDSLEVLLKALRQKNYDICIYTGWELEDIPDRILQYADYIKTGGFISELKNSGIQYVGSSNQHMFSLKGDLVQELNLSL